MGENSSFCVSGFITINVNIKRQPLSPTIQSRLAEFSCLQFASSCLLAKKKLFHSFISLIKRISACEAYQVSEMSPGPRQLRLSYRFVVVVDVAFFHAINGSSSNCSCVSPSSRKYEWSFRFQPRLTAVTMTHATCPYCPMPNTDDNMQAFQRCRPTQRARISSINKFRLLLAPPNEAIRGAQFVSSRVSAHLPDSSSPLSSLDTRRNQEASSPTY